MEGRALQRLVHAAVLAALSGARFGLPEQIGLGARTGWRPRSLRARARGREIVSLSSTKDSSSSRSAGERVPSVFRSIKFCRCQSVRAGKRSAATASTRLSGAWTTALIGGPSVESDKSRQQTYLVAFILPNALQPIHAAATPHPPSVP
jgi:hypothetical protein